MRSKATQVWCCYALHTVKLLGIYCVHSVRPSIRPASHAYSSGLWLCLDFVFDFVLTLSLTLSCILECRRFSCSSYFCQEMNININSRRCGCWWMCLHGGGHITVSNGNELTKIVDIVFCWQTSILDQFLDAPCLYGHLINTCSFVHSTANIMETSQSFPGRVASIRGPLY